MDGLDQMGLYKYFSDRGEFLLVKLKKATALSGGFEHVQNLDVALQHFPMPPGYMRYVTVRTKLSRKTLHIPIARPDNLAYVYGGNIPIWFNREYDVGVVINSFGERWDHNIFQFETQVS